MASASNPTLNEEAASSKASLLSAKTTSSSFTLSGTKKKAKSLLASLTKRHSQASDSSSTQPSSTSASSSVPSDNPLSSAGGVANKKHPQDRDWDAAFGELASSYGFMGGPIPGGRPVAPSRKFKARIAPDTPTTQSQSKISPEASASHKTKSSDESMRK